MRSPTPEGALMESASLPLGRRHRGERRRSLLRPLAFMSLPMAMALAKIFWMMPSLSPLRAR